MSHSKKRSRPPFGKKLTYGKRPPPHGKKVSEKEARDLMIKAIHDASRAIFAKHPELDSVSTADHKEEINRYVERALRGTGWTRKELMSENRRLLDRSIRDMKLRFGIKNPKNKNPSTWINHVKKVATAKGITYGEALSVASKTYNVRSTAKKISRSSAKKISKKSVKALSSQGKRKLSQSEAAHEVALTVMNYLLKKGQDVNTKYGTKVHSAKGAVWVSYGYFDDVSELETITRKYRTYGYWDDFGDGYFLWDDHE